MTYANMCPPLGRCETAVADPSQLGGRADDEEEELVDVILREVEEAMPGDPLFNFVVTREGFEGRLQCLLQVAVMAGRLGSSPRDLLLGRLQERLSHFHRLGANYGDEAVRRFVRSKRSVAEHALRQLVGSQG